MELDYNRFFVEDNKIRVFKYICEYTQKCWDYSDNVDIVDFSKRTYSQLTHTIYLAEESNIVNNTPESFENDYINKHANLNISSISPLDVSDILWMDGIEIEKDANEHDYIKQIYEMGEDNYKKSLTATVDDYMTNLDYRLCMIEMGL